MKRLASPWLLLLIGCLVVPGCSDDGDAGDDDDGSAGSGGSDTSSGGPATTSGGGDTAPDCAFVGGVTGAADATFNFTSSCRGVPSRPGFVLNSGEFGNLFGTFGLDDFIVGVGFDDFDVSVGATSAIRITVNDISGQEDLQWSESACSMEVTTHEVLTIDGTEADFFTASGTCPPDTAQTLGMGDTVVSIQPFTLTALTAR